MGVSEDVPALDIAYKLCAYGGQGRLKLSPGKQTYPGRKQVFRFEKDGEAVHDTISRAEEDLPGRPLLKPVMQDGRCLQDLTQNLEDIRSFAQKQLATLPEAISVIEPLPEPYPVHISDGLEAYKNEVIEKLEQEKIAGSSD